MAHTLLFILIGVLLGVSIMLEIDAHNKTERSLKSDKLPDETELKIIELQKHYAFEDKKKTIIAAVDLLGQHRKSELMYVRNKGKEWQEVQIKH